MINIDNHLIDEAEILIAWPNGKLILRNHGEAYVSEIAARGIIALCDPHHIPRQPNDSEETSPESLFRSMKLLQTLGCTQLSVPSDQRQLALCNLLSSFHDFLCSYVVCGGEILNDSSNVERTHR
jgi:hypothetical protein